MKNTLIRVFVVALALSGAVATVHTNNTRMMADMSGGGSFPIPICPPNDPDACGIH